MINGMFFDGASWNDEKMMIAEARPGEMFANVPVVHFEPAQNHECPDTKYSCPCYKTSVRAGELSTTGMSTNFVLCVEVPTDCSSKKWILQGECSEWSAWPCSCLCCYSTAERSFLLRAFLTCSSNASPHTGTAMLLNLDD